MNTIALPNFGILHSNIPAELYEVIRAECQSVDHSRVFKTGLSGESLNATHYSFKDDSQLKSYVTRLSKEYFDRFFLATDFQLRRDGNYGTDLFRAGDPWINFQSKGQWLKPHIHGGIFSYTIWMSIPKPSKFEIVYNTITGQPMQYALDVTPDMEGKIIMFPSLMTHCVHPYATGDEPRISVSGNIFKD